ncbi:hypothetical protein OROMI_021756 [Orobanche minor]
MKTSRFYSELMNLVPHPDNCPVDPISVEEDGNNCVNQHYRRSASRHPDLVLQLSTSTSRLYKFRNEIFTKILNTTCWEDLLFGNAWNLVRAVTRLVLLICVTKVAKSAFDKALAEHEDIDDVVGSEELAERYHGVDLQQPLLIKIDSSDNHRKRNLLLRMRINTGTQQLQLLNV